MHEFVSFSCLENRGALNHGRLFQHTSNIKESLESIWHVSGTYMIFPSVKPHSFTVSEFPSPQEISKKQFRSEIVAVRSRSR